MAKRFITKAKVWLYPGENAAWHFVNVDKKHTKELKEKYAIQKRGFGSIRVTAKIGKTSWNTSIFPDKQSGTYLLPLKAEVRRREGVNAKDLITFSVEPR